MLRQIVIVGMLFLIGGLVVGALAYTVAHKMVSNIPDRDASTLGATPPD